MGALIARISAATPPGRDRALDGLRAVAILGVVLGHWLVTALVVHDGGAVTGASPLRHLPYLVAASWIFQTLAVFFLVGGRVAAARSTPYPVWLRTRLTRLFRPVAALLAVWTVVAGALLLAGADHATVRTAATLVLSPLWFLLVFAGLTALTPLVARVHPGWCVLAVLAVDVLRLGLGYPAALGWLNLAAGWLVPYCLGMRQARGRFTSRRTGWLLLAGGLLATLALVRWAGYPASMVGVPGDGLSNLNPPTLAAVTFGLAQCGAATLLAPALHRLLTRRPAAWAAVALVNLAAMTVFLWHQSALLAVTAVAGLGAGALPGLHTTPDGLGWLAARLAWLPVFAAVLLGLVLVFRSYERGAGARVRDVPAPVR